MKRFSHFKVGDTLVEVALAIGIFSMVAIAVVSVVSSSSSSTQAALETTITREEIDSQAEALRFIHAAYNAGGELGGSDSEETRYESIWRAITKNAINIAEWPDDSPFKKIITNFKPSTSSEFSACSVLYDDKTDNNISIFKQNAFIINPRALSSGGANDVVIRASGASSSPDKFKVAATYPRLIYNGDTNALLNDTSDDTLQSAEGIYIVAVKDPKTTNIVSGDNNGGQTQFMSAYYDFYIHTCWYNPNEELPSTISTVVRLYDPDTVSTNEYSRSVVTIKFEGNGATSGSMPAQSVLSGKTTTLLKNKFERNDGLVFMGWDANNDGKVDFSDGGDFKAEPGLQLNTTVELKAVWGYRYTLMYYDTDNTTVICTQEGLTEEDSFTFNIKEGTGSATPDNGNSTGCPNTIELTLPGNSESEFRGWATNAEGSGDWYTIDGRNDTKKSIVVTRDSGQNIKLYPVWRVVITFSESTWSKEKYNGGWRKGKTENQCEIFQVNTPDTYKSEVKAGTVWVSHDDGKQQDIAPMDGYLVYRRNGENIEMFKKDGFGEGINFQGYCSNAEDVNIGITHEIDPDDTFELSAKMNTVNMLSHPSGHVTVKIGPLSVKISKDNNGSVEMSPSCGDPEGQSSKFFNNANTISLKLKKYDNTYSVLANDEEIGNCKKPNYVDDPENNKIHVSYYMHHSIHSCDLVFNFQLTNINMTQVKKD